MINLDKVRAEWVEGLGPVGVVVAELCAEIEALRAQVSAERAAASAEALRARLERQDR